MIMPNCIGLKVFKALILDAHEGWCWLRQPGIKRRSVVKITNRQNNKSIYVEALEIDEDFIGRYNKRCDEALLEQPNSLIQNPESSLVINRWYRENLGTLESFQCYPLEIRPANGWIGKFRAYSNNPQLIVRLSAKIAMLSFLLGCLSVAIAIVSLFEETFSCWAHRLLRLLLP
jgi:hypothetical protein